MNVSDGSALENTPREMEKYFVHKRASGNCSLLLDIAYERFAWYVKHIRILKMAFIVLLQPNPYDQIIIY